MSTPPLPHQSTKTNPNPQKQDTLYVYSLCPVSLDWYFVFWIFFTNLRIIKFEYTDRDPTTRACTRYLEKEKIEMGYNSTSQHVCFLFENGEPCKNSQIGQKTPKWRLSIVARRFLHTWDTLERVRCGRASLRDTIRCWEPWGGNDFEAEHTANRIRQREGSLGEVVQIDRDTFDAAHEDEREIFCWNFTQ